MVFEKSYFWDTRYYWLGLLILGLKVPLLKCFICVNWDTPFLFSFMNWIVWEMNIQVTMNTKNWSCKFCHCRFDLFFSFVIVSFIFSIFKILWIVSILFSFRVISCSLCSWECFVLVLSVPFQSLSNLCRTRIWHSPTQWLQFWNETCSF